MIIILNDSSTFPKRTLGAYRIATVLREAGAEVEVIDFISKWPVDTLISYIDRIKDIEWVGFSSKFGLTMIDKSMGMFTDFSQADETKLIRYIKSRNLTTVLGGPTADFVRPLLVKNTIDFVVRGYADQAVLALHDHITKDQPLIFTTIDGQVLIDGDKDYANVDLSNIETYYHDSDFIIPNEIFPLEIGRGCIFSCAFCNFPHIGKKPGTYFKSKESIKREIVDRYNKYGSMTFSFLDDTFNDSIDKMNMIVEIRKETGIPFEFWAYCRLDVLAAQEEMQRLLPELGWISMTFGIETFNRTSGKAIGKGADPEKLKTFMIELRKAHPHIQFEINIIVGLPHDSEDTIRNTIDWFNSHSDIANPNLIPLSIYNVNDPGKRQITSKMSRDPEKYGYTTKVVPGGRWPSIFLDWKTDNMTQAEAVELTKRLKKEFKRSPGKIADSPLQKLGLSPTGQMDITEDYINKKFSMRT
jgi:radical SAM superfamily enzyme YgiQ (UPF0313 family)